ncbi:MAG: hypothetical protein U0176_07625 [Bacteroidia bacterium]
MRHLSIGLVLMLLCTQAFAQKKEGIHKGMFRTQGTVALGIDINKVTKEQRYYIYGESEYLLSDHIGVNGSAWFNIGSSEHRLIPLGTPEEEGYVHSALAGPVFHAFSNQPLDLYVGIQPGFSLTVARTVAPFDGVQESIQLSPTATVHGGVAYYGSFFHLFAQARYVRTQHTNINDIRQFNDLRLCIGLGFNFF